VKLSTSAWAENCSLATEAGQKYSTLEGQMALSKNATNRLAVAVGDDLKPAFTLITGVTAKFMSWLADVAEKSPVVSVVLSMLGTGLGVVTLALGALSVAGAISAAKTAIMGIAAAGAAPGVTLLGAAIQLATGPVGWIVLGVTALTAGFIALTSAMSKSKEEYSAYTGVTNEQYEMLTKLDDEYENAKRLYGENSEKALELKSTLDTVADGFGASRKSLSDWVAESDGLQKAVSESSRAYKEAISEINREEIGVNGLIGKLEMLGNKTNRSATETAAMKAIIEKLNGTLPGLNLTYEGFIGSVDSSSESLKKYVKAQYEAQKAEESSKAYVEALMKQAELTDKIAEAERGIEANRKESKYRGLVCRGGGLRCLLNIRCGLRLITKRRSSGFQFCLKV
jgi:hypothetical protein